MASTAPCWCRVARAASMRGSAAMLSGSAGWHCGAKSMAVDTSPARSACQSAARSIPTSAASAAASPPPPPPPASPPERSAKAKALPAPAPPWRGAASPTGSARHELESDAASSDRAATPCPTAAANLAASSGGATRHPPPC
eukprot:scaffold82179_cov60-Phaeocystis_antarctica.AAC.1